MNELLPVNVFIHKLTFAIFYQQVAVYYRYYCNTNKRGQQWIIIFPHK